MAWVVLNLCRFNRHETDTYMHIYIYIHTHIIQVVISDLMLQAVFFFTTGPHPVGSTTDSTGLLGTWKKELKRWVTWDENHEDFHGDFTTKQKHHGKTM